MELHVKPIEFTCDCGAVITLRHMTYLGVAHTIDLYLEVKCSHCQDEFAIQVPFADLIAKASTLPVPNDHFTIRDLAYLKELHIADQKGR